MAGLCTELKQEVLRKSLHCLIALAAPLAEFGNTTVIVLLAAGAFFYAMAEVLRLKGRRVPIFSTVSSITVKAARKREAGFIWGPITLATGAIASLILFQKPVLDAAIYSLAFGDGLAGLVGRLIGRLRPAFMRGKSVEGSLACFVAVLISVFIVFEDWRMSFAAAGMAAFVEALPLKESDNIAIPLTVGFLSDLLFF
ncbi:MAG: phosphatidate cytidylyltransferase [Treponema sp.]|nr:phosphatidate cytidylyltransferase [Treponema sp.]